MRTALIVTFYTLLLSTIAFLFLFLSTPQYIQRGSGKVASPEIKAAMIKMGPLKDYRVLPNGRLQVLVKEKWLYLKY